MVSSAATSGWHPILNQTPAPQSPSEHGQLVDGARPDSSSLSVPGVPGGDRQDSASLTLPGVPDGVRIRPPTSEAFSVGERVERKLVGSWSDATIEAILGPDSYELACDGGGENFQIESGAQIRCKSAPGAADSGLPVLPALPLVVDDMSASALRALSGDGAMRLPVCEDGEVFTEGQKVTAKRDSEWLAATIFHIVEPNVYLLTWEDGFGRDRIKNGEDIKTLAVREPFQLFKSAWFLQRKQMHQRLQQSLETSLDLQEELVLKFLRLPPCAATAGLTVCSGQRVAEKQDSFRLIEDECLSGGSSSVAPQAHPPQALNSRVNMCKFDSSATGNTDLDQDDMQSRQTPRSRPGRRRSISNMSITGTTSVSHVMSDRTRSRKKRLFNMESEDPPSASNLSMAEKLRGQCLTSLTRWQLWWQSLKEPKRSGILLKITKNVIFEGFIATSILANAFYIAYTSNYEIQHNATPKSDEIIEPLFLSIFTGEMALKICVHRLYIFCNEDALWNIFDLFLVSLAVANIIMLELMYADGGNVSFARSLRIFRVAKSLRILRTLRHFKELRVMLVSILGSFKSLFWSFVMVGLILFINALFFVQQMAVFIADGEMEELHEMQLTYYGSVQTTMLTLCMATTGGADWAELFNLVKPLGVIYAAAFIFYIVFFLFVVMNILTGLFVENALSLCQPNEEELMQARKAKQAKDMHDLKQLLALFNEHGDGFLTEEEFTVAAQNDDVVLYLQALGIDVKDTKLVFSTLTTEIAVDDCISIHEFVCQAMSMSGPASSIDLHGLIDQAAETFQAVTQIAAHLNDIGVQMVKAPAPPCL